MIKNKPLKIWDKAICFSKYYFKLLFSKKCYHCGGAKIKYNYVTVNEDTVEVYKCIECKSVSYT